MATMLSTFTLGISPTGDVNSMMATYEALRRVRNVREMHYHHMEDDRAIYTVSMDDAVSDQRFAAGLARELGREVHVESQSDTYLILRIGDMIAVPPVTKPTPDTFPEQAGLDRPVAVTFPGFPQDSLTGKLIRNDRFGRGEVTIIKLEDGRLVLGSECEWSYVT